MDTCTLYTPSVTRATVAALKSRYASPLPAVRSASSQVESTESQVNRVLALYNKMIVEVAPGDPSLIIHRVSDTAHLKPFIVYCILLRAGKMAPSTSHAETVAIPVQAVEESSPAEVSPAARPFAPERLFNLVAAVARWVARCTLVALSPLEWGGVLPALAYLEDAIRLRTLHPHPKPVAPKVSAPQEEEVDESWIR